MSKNLEVAKKIVRAYWREVANDAEYGRSGMSYNDVIVTLLYLDDDMEKHIEAVANIMNKALKEMQKEKNEQRNQKTRRGSNRKKDRKNL